MALKHLSNADERMGKLIDKFGPPNFNLMNNYYESLVRSIIYQQLSGKAASIICLLYTSPSPRDGLLSRMPSSA